MNTYYTIKPLVWEESEDHSYEYYERAEPTEGWYYEVFNDDDDDWYWEPDDRSSQECADQEEGRKKCEEHYLNRLEQALEKQTGAMMAMPVGTWADSGTAFSISVGAIPQEAQPKQSTDSKPGIIWFGEEEKS